MPAPTTSIRRESKSALVSLLSAKPALASVQVSYGWPGRLIEGEYVYVGAARGRNEVAGIKAGRRQRDDLFDIEVWIVAAKPGQDDAEEAETRVEALYAELEDAVAVDSRLGGTVDGLLWAVVGNVDGPDAIPTDEGWQGFMRAEVACKSRLI